MDGELLIFLGRRSRVGSGSRGSSLTFMFALPPPASFPSWASEGGFDILAQISLEPQLTHIKSAMVTCVKY